MTARCNAAMYRQRGDVRLPVRVHVLAKELGVTTKHVLLKLAEINVVVMSASSAVDDHDAARLKRAFGQPDGTALPIRFRGQGRPQGHNRASWRAGEIQPSNHPDTIANLNELHQDFGVSRTHREALAELGSQFVYSTRLRIPKFEDCSIALVRFSGAIENAFGLTREVAFFYSPYHDFQNRTFHAAREALTKLPREVTPDVIFFSAPDPGLRDKLSDWTSGKFLAIPVQLFSEDPAMGFIALLRDYIFSRDLFNETTPVKGDQFFGRKKLLHSMRDDAQNQRVVGLFGLRKSGKTSVLNELAANMKSAENIVVLRDLESLPSPPLDPIPDLIRDLAGDLAVELRNRKLRSVDLSDLTRESSITDFKNALQAVLRKTQNSGVRIIVMLDEIEYLTPSDKIDILEGDMTSVAQFLGALRSLVQENHNFTFMLSGLTSAIIENGRLYGRPNPLFSWAKANFLSPFERHEADDLALTIGKKMGIEIETDALEALFDASGGHAFLYRNLASQVVATQLPMDVYSRVMRRSDILHSLRDWQLNIAGNLQEMLSHVRRYYPQESYLLDVLRDEPENFDEIVPAGPLQIKHLLGLGLIKREGNSYSLSSVLELL